MQRDALAGFVDANEGEAELRLARISFGIQGNQRPPHQPGQSGADQGVGESAPDHVTRNSDGIARYLERDLRGQCPQHPDKGDDLEQRIDNAAAEVGGGVPEQARVLLYPLVWVAPIQAGKAELIDAHRLEPLDQEVTGDPLAQSKLQAFLKKSLRDRERQQHGNGDDKRPKKMHEGRQVLAAHGVEKLAVPLIKPHLSEHVGNSDHDRGNEDRQHKSPTLRPPQHTREQAQVARKIEVLHGHGRDFVRKYGFGCCDRYNWYDRRYGLQHPRRLLRRKA